MRRESLCCLRERYVRPTIDCKQRRRIDPLSHFSIKEPPLLKAALPAARRLASPVAQRERPTARSAPSVFILQPELSSQVEQLRFDSQAVTACAVSIQA